MKKFILFFATVLVLGITPGCGRGEEIIIPQEVVHQQPNRVVPSGSVVITEENFDEVMAGLDDEARFGHFNTEMNIVWTFPDSSQPSVDAHVANSVANVVPMFFEVELEDTGEIVFTSPVMPVGSKIADMTLGADVAPGSHPAICTFILLDEEGEQRSEVSVAITLVVLD